MGRYAQVTEHLFDPPHDENYVWQYAVTMVKEPLTENESECRYNARVRLFQRDDFGRGLYISRILVEPFGSWEQYYPWEDPPRAFPKRLPTDLAGTSAIPMCDANKQ